MMEMVRRNGVPSLIAGASVSWLLMNRESSQRRLRRRESRDIPEMIEDTVSEARETAGDMVSTVSDATIGLSDVIRENPVPSTLVGVGLGWLAMNAVSPRQGRRVRHAMEVEGEPLRRGRAAAERTFEDVRGLAEEAREGAEGVVERASDVVGDTAELVRTVTEDVVDQTQETVGYVTHEAQHQAERVADGAGLVAEAIRENPIPVALMGLGLGLMVLNVSGPPQGRVVRGRVVSRRGQGKTGRAHMEENPTWASEIRDQAQEMVGRASDVVGENAERAFDTAEHAVGQVQETVGNLAHDTQYGVGRIQHQFRHLALTNPLALGMGALALGAIIGATLPGAEPMPEMPSATRAKSTRKARGSAERATKKVERVVAKAQSTAERKARQQAPIH